MTSLPISVMDLIRRQHGVVSRRQLHAHELTKSQIETLRRAGVLTDVLRGVYHVPLTPFDEAARSTAVCQGHPELVICGPTAGRHWGFRQLPADHRIHVIAPPMSHPTGAKWIVPYRTSALHAEDVIELADGRRITLRARTALDLARHVTAINLLSIIEQAVCDGRLDSDELRRTAIDWISPQRRWLRDCLLTVEQRVQGGAAESHHEVLLGDALESGGLRGLRRQHTIDLPGYGPARFDLAVPSLRWAIEVDVFPTHAETAGQANDTRRDVAASKLGWTTTRLGPERFGPALRSTVAELLSTAGALRNAA